jgi:Trk K+ transport system NAD-binding subunit
MSGISEIVIEANSPLVGKSLRDSELSRSVLITSIERGRQVITPSGDSVIQSGDRLMVLASPSELGLLTELAGARPPLEK